MAGAFFSGRHEGVVEALSANEVIVSLRKCLITSLKVSWFDLFTVILPNCTCNYQTDVSFLLASASTP